MVHTTLKKIDSFNKGMLGKRGSMKNSSIFTAPGLKKAVDKDRSKKVKAIKKIRTKDIPRIRRSLSS